ncbi:MAG TPA: LysM domain-containing protein [Acidimicrobiales bacterium]|nr:LysM domain-containing protein [Acidimicrobiales bacterium]
MAAVTRWDESTWDDAETAPSLYLLPPVAPARRSRASLYRRRRLLVAALAIGFVLMARWVLGGLDGGPLTAAGPARADLPALSSPLASPAATHVVQPGDTFWTIARSLQPEGDVRPLVMRLSAGRHGQPLRVGERVALP